ncbi:Gfo/Idh/MocA family protein [Thalassobacillus sp. CUG 92003]|uniref:Gfo/Idh/MocA family protein n=1 Tax=Thalassobacillus sp. CUG 92003 TaxID=2736641 RepID=UPI0015E7275A|nr:Gfo/Idh/MocA family oxidoreductase [Thalassobacillus sp. CUG 92003]
MVRFGIIGTNFITERLLDHIKGYSEFSLAAIYSRTEERASEFARQYGVETTFTNLEDMANSPEVDAVYIASPNALHSKQSIMMMEHGKHVLCEKPLASNEKEAAAMIKAAQENDVVLMEAMKTTLLPSFTNMTNYLPKIGKIRRYCANYCKYSSRYDAYRDGKNVNTFNPKFSNGSLMDLGVYCLYPMVVWFGEPDSIKANGVKLASGVDGEGSLVASYEERGMEAVITHSKISDSFTHSEIQGEDGSILIDNISDPTHIELKYRDGNIELIHELEKPSMFYEVQEFIERIKTGEHQSTLNSHKHSLITMRILDEARAQMGVEYPADSE